MTVLTTSVAASAVAVLGTAGLVGSGAATSPAAADGADTARAASARAVAAPTSPPATSSDAPSGTPSAAVQPDPAEPAEPAPTPAIAAEAPLPPASGQGRRAVFDQSEQRVWLVGAGDEVRRTYLVSGSVYDNLDPGTYEVFSRSKQAWGIDDSGEMTHFVRFARGDNAAIGFHAIPTKDGEPLQGLDELGTATSHGCIRQATPDAVAMWRFAQLGDTVVVTA